MHALQTVLSILAATSLAAALLVPLRDDRRGKRATLGGRVPLLALFPSARSRAAVETAVAGERNGPVEGGVADFRGPANVVAGDEAPATPLSRFFDRRVSAQIIEALGLGIFARHVSALPAGDMGDTQSPQATEADAHAAADCERSFAEELQLLSGAPDDSDLTPGHGEPARDPNDRQQIVSALRQAQGDAEMGAAATARATGETDATRNALANEFASMNEFASANEGAGAERGADADLRTWSVPPTRLPLRRAQAAVQWPLELPIPQIAASRAERHAALARLVGNADASCERALRAAYEQEDLAGRIVALRAIEHVRGNVSREVLVDALRRGADEERVVAVDALARRDDREALIEGLSDRVDAIAARAALGLVGTNVRADFERVLAPHVERGRLDALLALLAPALL